MLEAADEPGERRGIAHRNRGNAHRARGDTTAALADLGRAVELDAGSAVSLTDRGALLLDIDELEQAEADFERALEKSPCHPPALLGRAAVEERRGRPLAAIAALDRAIDLVPGQARAHASRARLLAHLRQLDRALVDAERAMVLAPDDVWAIEARGTVHRLREALAEAKADFDRLVMLSPFEARGYLLRASVHSDLRDHQAAIVDYSAALTRQPRSVEALAGRAWSRHLAGDHTGAIADAEAAQSVDERMPGPWATRGLSLLAKGETVRAHADLEAALQRDDTLRAAWVGRARIRLEAGEPLQALSDLEKAMSLPMGGIDDREAAEAALQLLEEARARSLAGATAEPRPASPLSNRSEVSPANAAFALPPLRATEPPVWSMSSTAVECRLSAQWDDRALIVFARAGLLGAAPGLQIGLALERSSTQLQSARSQPTFPQPQSRQRKVEARLTDMTGAVPSSDLGRRMVAQALNDDRDVVSIGPLQLEFFAREVTGRDAAVMEIDGEATVYPLGDVAFWLPALEQCARGLPREVR